MTPAERLRAAIHMESAAIAPQTSPLLEAAKEVLAENEKMRLFLGEIAAMGPADEEWDADTLAGAVAVAKRGLAVHQQLTPEKE